MTDEWNQFAQPEWETDGTPDKSHTIRTPHTKDRPYVSTARQSAQDSRLSFEARGVLWYLLSKPDDWKIVIGDIIREGGIGRDKAKRILKELRDCGYLETERFRNDEGLFTGSVIRLHEVAIHSTEKASDGAQSTVLKSQRMDNPKIHNTESLEIKETNAPKNGATISTAPLPEMSFDDLPSYAQSVANGAQPVKTKRRLLEEAILEAFGWDEQRITANEKGQLSKAVAQLWKAKYRAEHIPTIYGYCAKHFTNFTPLALASHAQAALNEKASNGVKPNPLGNMKEVF